MNTGRSGRGPTIDISPLRTFRSCGNSSRLVERRILPNGVTRLSPGVVHPGPWLSALAYIVLNLTILKRLPSKLTRSCLKNTGPREVSFTRAAISTMRGEKSSNAAHPSTRSTTRFVKRLIPSRGHSWRLITGSPSNSSIAPPRLANWYRSGTILISTMESLSCSMIAGSI